MEKKKEILITGSMVGRIASILGLISCLVLIITGLVKGTDINWTLILSICVGCGVSLILTQKKEKE